ncbi:hypothetical protein [Emticicia sp. W12TSBA100-4]|uniref:hypothetical protein n=1 Tax=Emticicia sp. W12TSBA100-4 TaxID=3160965 RepID=UPI003306736E
MENQEKQSISYKPMDFIINFFVGCVPTRKELKTQKLKSIYKILLLMFGILVGLSIIGVLIAIYLLGIFLMVIGKMLSIGSSFDQKHEKSQDRYFDENGKYY